MRIPHTVLLLGVGKYALNCLLPLPVHILHPNAVPVVVRMFNIFLPYMTGDNLYMVFAVRTLLQMWTIFAVVRFAFILPVTIAVGGTVFERFVARTYVTVVLFIINIVVFAKKTVLRFRPGSRHQRRYAIK